MSDEVTERLSDDNLDELVEFIITMRTEPERTFWFIGRYVESDNDADTLISESMRGEFEGGAWHPLDVEQRECCKPVSNGGNPFALMDHCCEDIHIRALLSDLTDVALQREYDYMLEHVFESLTDDWTERV